MELKTVKSEGGSIYFLDTKKIPPEGDVERRLDLASKYREKLLDELDSIPVIKKVANRAFVEINDEADDFTALAIGFGDYANIEKAFDVLKNDILTMCSKVSKPIVLFRELLLLQKDTDANYYFYSRLLVLEGK